MGKRRRIWILPVVLVGILAILAGIYFWGGWKVTVTLSGREVQMLEYGETFQDPGAQGTLSGFLLKECSVPVSVEQTEFDGLGTYTLTYEAAFLGYRGQATRQVEVVDTTPPEIKLAHIEGHYTRPVDAYVEEGFSAVDAYDGDLTDQVERREADGIVYYTVTDSSGNRAEVKREIYYDDREAPVITFQGEDPLTIEKGMPVLVDSCSVIDDCDGDISEKVQITEQNGILTYTVSDSYGNTATATRPATVVDTLAPEITLSGKEEIWLHEGEYFAEPGYTAIDAGEGDLTANVVVEGTVNNEEPGSYVLNYSVSDSVGNTGTARRVVHVGENDPASGGKVIYLTFDDGPGPYTQKLLDILAKYNAKVTFFVTGANSEYRHLIGTAFSQGHAIGIHTYTHNYSQIYASEEAYFEDLNRMQEIIKAQTGQETTLVRFPGGSSNMVSSFNPGIMTRLTSMVEERGFQYFDWNVTSGDAGETTSTSTVAQNVINGIQTYKTAIVLQHDIKSFSVDAVESILSWGTQNGYTFLPLTADSPTAHHGINN